MLEKMETTSTVVFFRVFRFLNCDEEYILEKHLVGTNEIKRYRAKLIRDNRDATKWTVKINGLEPGDHAAIQVLEDPVRPRFVKQYPLSLDQRVNTWLVEQKPRAQSSKIDTFHKHWYRKFRSFVDAAGFIIYGCEPRFLEEIPRQNRFLGILQQREEMVLQV